MKKHDTHMTTIAPVFVSVGVLVGVLALGALLWLSDPFKNVVRSMAKQDPRPAQR